MDIGKASGSFLEEPPHTDPATRPGHAKAIPMLIGIRVLHNYLLIDPISALFLFCLAGEVSWVKFQTETPEENKLY